MRTTSRSRSRSPSTEAARACLLLALVLAESPARAQMLTSTGPLAFGAFSAGSGGTVNLSAVGARSKTGSVMLSSQGTFTAAQFLMSGTPSASFHITLPANGTVVLTDGPNSMALNGFVSNPNGAGTLGGGGTLTITVGAVLTVGSAQAPGNYTGSFNVTVDYP